MFVYHGDKDAFLKGNIEPDPDELDMVFDSSPSYAELLQQVRKDLNWMDPSDIIELDGSIMLVLECTSVGRQCVSIRSNVELHTRRWWPNH